MILFAEHYVVPIYIHHLMVNQVGLTCPVAMGFFGTRWGPG
ncbi:hypothetical protein ACVWZ6_004613 [Bradyrhizobium sp. GM6.1]|jgi:hypothetical protein